MGSSSIDRSQLQPQGRHQDGNMKASEEKQAQQLVGSTKSQPEGRRSLSFAVGVACVAFLIVLQQVSSSASAQELEFRFGASAAPQIEGSAEASAEFDWLSITPNADLEYHPCYDGAFQCARLELPLNYLDESDTRTVAIAMMKLPATVPDDDPAFGGSLFFNPGGPGHAGTLAMPNVASLLQGYFDIPDERHYEIIGFDSRGLGWSTPVANCFLGTNELARQVVNYEFRGLGANRADRYSTAYFRAIYSGENQRCAAVADGEAGGSIFSYMSTPSVVEDMVNMIDKIQELREGGSSPNATVTRQAEDVARLNYIGFSYGTALGNYFASMYPGRVGHMILDSVVDIEDYVSAPGWLTNVEDMDATFVQFLKGCWDAIPELCPMRKPEDSSWEDMETRFWAFITELNAEPQATLSEGGYTITVTGSDFLSFIGTAAYSPITTFTTLAYIIGAGFDGDFDPMVRVLVASGYTPQIDAFCPGNVTTVGSDSIKAIACGDSEDETDRDLDYWDDYVRQQNETSAVWGAEMANVKLPCGSWTIRPEYTFFGPFTTPEASSTPTEGVPLAPLLFLTNEYDPVTPASAARRMAESHPGAQVIVQNSMGHGVVTNAPSNCTRDLVQEFMKSGTVPDEEKFCEVSCDPWDPEGCVNPWAPGPTDGIISKRNKAARGAQLDMLHDLRQRMKDFPLGIYF